MSVAVLRAHAASLPLPDGSVDLIVTSPPYFGLRDYGYAGQIGSEGTPAEWLDALAACTREWVRVLKPEGSLFVNLGDKYVSNPGHPEGQDKVTGRGPRTNRSGAGFGARPKSLLGLPWRYALACMDDLGLILRAEIVWAKPNGLPESVQDRVRRAHEQVFHFTRHPRYYAAVDEIREPHLPVSLKRAMPHRANVLAHEDRHEVDMTQACHPLGKLPGSVWTIPSQPLVVPAHLGVDHFAAFPMELPRRVILGWSPPGVCTACGQGRRPVSVRGDEPVKVWDLAPTGTDTKAGHRHGIDGSTLGVAYTRTITGYACACGSFPASQVNPVLPSSGTVGLDAVPDVEPLGPLDASLVHADSQRRTAPACPPTRPAIVLDPFGGTGTTALVASVLGRHGITADLSADYCRLAAWRTTDSGERARAMQVPKPPPVADGQEALFTL